MEGLHFEKLRHSTKFGRWNGTGWISSPLTSDLYLPLYENERDGRGGLRPALDGPLPTPCDAWTRYRVGCSVRHWAAHAHFSLAKWLIDQFSILFFFFWEIPDTDKFFPTKYCSLKCCGSLEDVRDPFWLCRPQTAWVSASIFSFSHHWMTTSK